MIVSNIYYNTPPLLLEEKGSGVEVLMIQPQKFWVKNDEPIKMEYWCYYAQSFFE